jgi:aspartyl-tRNA(Asn)/glutamyl-tRNA(Gln) amidotransferase subunit B
MRLKSNAIDYRFFREPNIVQINIEALTKETQKQINDLPELIKNKLLANKVPMAIIDQLLDNYSAYKAYKYVDNKINNPGITVTWILVELAAIIKRDDKTFNDISQDAYDLIVELIELLIAQKINGKQAKSILEHVYKEHKHPEELIKELDFKQITDEKTLGEMLNKYIKENEAMVKQYKERPERVEKFIIGLLMRDTKGQANPEISTKLLKSLLK